MPFSRENDLGTDCSVSDLVVLLSLRTQVAYEKDYVSAELRFKLVSLYDFEDMPEMKASYYAHEISEEVFSR